MSSNIVPYISAQEQEIARKREELAILQAELTDRELSLANLRAEIAAFEGRYLREVGVLYAELDEWNAKIAEFAAEAAGTEQARAAASEARAQAEESYAAAHGDAAKAGEYSRSPEIDKLFREVARHIHPDLTDDEADRALRTRLMAEANLARDRGDADALRKILDEYKGSPESVRGDGAAADLKRILLQIERILRRLAEIETEVARLTSSEIAMLMAKVQIAKSKGRSLLVEMAKDLRRRIQIARSEYQEKSTNLRTK